MTTKSELTEDELATHGMAIAGASTDDEFIAAFAAYMKDTVERDEDPYQKVALFVHSFTQGLREMNVELMRLRGGGRA